MFYFSCFSRDSATPAEKDSQKPLKLLPSASVQLQLTAEPSEGLEAAEDTKTSSLRT